MVLTLVILLIVGAAFLVGYYEVPKMIERWQQWQAKRSKEASYHLENAFIFVGKKEMRMVYIAIPVILGIMGFFMFKFIGAAIGIVLGIVIPQIIISTIIERRKAKFNHQLVDTLMIISSCLKGGLSLVQSFEVVMDEMPPPTSDEFSLVVRETKVGVSLEESLVKLNQRMSSEDVDLVISSILVARETGGDLTKVFSRLINTIRDRMEIKDMAATLTLQGRIQGIIMSMIPPVFVVFILKSNPHHFDLLLKDDIGRALIFVAVILQILALFFIKKFSTVKV